MFLKSVIYFIYLVVLSESNLAFSMGNGEESGSMAAGLTDSKTENGEASVRKQDHKSKSKGKHVKKPLKAEIPEIEIPVNPATKEGAAYIADEYWNNKKCFLEKVQPEILATLNYERSDVITRRQTKIDIMEDKKRELEVSVCSINSITDGCKKACRHFNKIEKFEAECRSILKYSESLSGKAKNIQKRAKGDKGAVLMIDDCYSEGIAGLTSEITVIDKKIESIKKKKYPGIEEIIFLLVKFYALEIKK